MLSQRVPMPLPCNSSRSRAVLDKRTSAPRVPRGQMKNYLRLKRNACDY